MAGSRRIKKIWERRKVRSCGTWRWGRICWGRRYWEVWKRIHWQRRWE